MMVLDAGGGVAVAEDDHAGGASGVLGLGDLGKGHRHSVVKVGGVADGEAVDSGLDFLFAGDPLRGHEEVNDLFKGDDAEDVAWPEEVDDVGAGLLGVLEGRAFHAAATVEDETKVEWRARGVGGDPWEGGLGVIRSYF